MFVAHLPKTGRGGVVRNPFEHERDGAVRKRSVKNISVAGDPADICSAPVNVALVIIEYVLVGDRRIEEVTASRVQYALGLPGRTRGVKDEEWVLCAHFLAGAIGGHWPGTVLG